MRQWYMYLFLAPNSLNAIIFISFTAMGDDNSLLQTA